MPTSKGRSLPDRSRIDVAVLGAGVTGLAAGMASGGTVFEAESMPGGLCASYYMGPGGEGRGYLGLPGGCNYRFEPGGGHWIFGGEPEVLDLICSIAPCRQIFRRSSVFLHRSGQYIPYPLQNNLRYLGATRAARALEEIRAGQPTGRTMAEWLQARFGSTLFELFFAPFHEAYTAGLYERAAPQDGFKSPIDLERIERGAREGTEPAGYNASFLYPEQGLTALVSGMARRTKVRYGMRALQIDPERRLIRFTDGSAIAYRHLVSTLPLNQTCALAGVHVDTPPDPYTSVLVLNIGATRGARCPDEHWVYTCGTDAGFHRVGFYSNVDSSFAPDVPGERRVSVYVEKAYAGGTRLTQRQISSYTGAAISELRRWGYIDEVEVVDPSWVEVAYTWSWPDSTWRTAAIAALESHGILPAGRYGRWIFQGIAESIQSGLAVADRLQGATEIPTG